MDSYFSVLAAGMQKEQMEEVPNSFSFLPLHIESEGKETANPLQMEPAWADLVMEGLPYRLTLHGFIFLRGMNLRLFHMENRSLLRHLPEKHKPFPCFEGIPQIRHPKIGAKTEQLFHNLGVYTIGDILLHYPKDYDKLPPTPEDNLWTDPVLPTPAG